MKRPPGLWILLAAGVLWLSLQDVYGIRATALIFGKSSTSTTTTTEAPTAPSAEGAEERASNNTVSSGGTEEANSTKPTLTGKPQIDYVWDPNLPQELNGFNLSDYPFYERVPDETIEFKCDGLHDGFYASVPHKCQVYHHCLFGTRYDFLCANYTAFDQKTFICHFASEVDCANSKKFWHRNDALYQEASTTTTPRPLNLALYTPAPPVGDPITPLPATAQEAVARRPAGARRPFPRRRPQLDYYDDYYYDDEYYEERPRPRKRPRPKPRPIYEDEEYDENYEDERYEKPRGGGRRRRPYRRPTRRRTKDRRKDDYDDEVEDKFEDDDFKTGGRKKGNDKRKVVDEYIDDEEDAGDRRRPSHKSTTKRRQPDDDEVAGKEKKSTHRNRRPIRDEYEDEIPQGDDSRSYERPRKAEKNNKDTDSRPVIKPVSGSIYDRPRLAPRINLPVPKNAADKFAYKNIGAAKTPTSTTTKAVPLEDEEYYEDEYEEPVSTRPKYNRRHPQSSREQSDLKPKNRDRDREDSKETRKEVASSSKGRPRRPETSTEQTTEKTSRPKYTSKRPKYGRTSTKRPSSTTEEYYDDYEEEDNKNVKDLPQKHSKEKSTTPTTTSTTTTEAPKEKHDPIIRVVKRPFLPSRGGNPYSARGLQPVGLKATDKNLEEDEQEKSESKEEETLANDSREPVSSIREEERQFKPSPVVVKIPVRKMPPTVEAKEMFNSEQSRPQPEIRQQTYKEGPRTTQKPKVVENPPEQNPLDLNEFDVTLNDALNPTLPNLPVRGFPTGFGGQEYAYHTFQRPRYVIADPVVSQSNPEYVYQIKPVRQQQQRYETPALSNQRTQHDNLGNFRQKESQPASHTQALYRNY